MTPVETAQKLAEAMEAGARLDGFTAAGQAARKTAEALRAVLSALGAAERDGAFGNCTGDSCPTWHDGCHCTVETLRHNIRRAEAAEAREAKLRDYLLRSSVCGAPGDWYLSGPIVDGLGRGLPFPADVVAAILAAPAPAAKPEEE